MLWFLYVLILFCCVSFKYSSAEHQDQTENILEIDTTESPRFIPVTSRPITMSSTDTRASTDLSQTRMALAFYLLQNIPSTSNNNVQPSNSQHLNYDLTNSQNVPNMQENNLVVDNPPTISNFSASNLPTTSDLPPSYSCLNVYSNPNEPLPPSYSQCNLSSLN